MDRRRFLTLSAMSFLATACGSSSDKTPPVKAANLPEQPPLTNTSDIPEESWHALSEQLKGSLLRPSDEGYGNARLVFNTRFDHINPEALIQCGSEQDVVNALAFVKEHNLNVVPRCGGHGYAGYATTDGIVIDVSGLNSINVTDGRATIGAGARLVDVYDQLTLQGVSIPAGSCLSVGIAGLTLGGGFGVVDRAYGLTCDTLVEAKVVTADGEILTCNEREHADLFWALRGGGGGNFGVVTEFTFKTHVAQDIHVFEAYFNFNDFSDVMIQWQTLNQIWPNEMWCQVIPNWLSQSPTLYVRAFCLNSIAEATRHWDAFIARISAQPISNSVATNSYRNVMLGNCEDTVPTCHIATQVPGGILPRSAFAASSDFFAKPWTTEAIATMKEFIDSSYADNKRGMLIINTLGGAIDNLSVDETAYPHRNAQFSIEYYGPMRTNSSNAQIDANQQWMNEFREVMSNWSTGGAYVNYIDPLIVDWQQAYYGENYARLQAVKAKYDSERVFNIPQGVRA